MTIWQRWKQTSLHNKALVFSGVIVAFGTLFYSGAAVVQVCMFNRSSKQAQQQTDKLITAANIQACAATKNAAAADKFAASADGINIQTKLAVDKFDRMAKASEDSIRTIQKTAKDALDASVQASRLDERPWIVGDGFTLSNEPDAGKMPTVNIQVRNTGKTPALNLIPISQVSISDQCPVLDETTIPPPKSIGMLAPGQSGMSFENIDPPPYIKAAMDVYNAGLARYCVRIKITYMDVNQIPHWTTICVSHTHGHPLNTLDYCSNGNDVDKNK